MLDTLIKGSAVGNLARTQSEAINHLKFKPHTTAEDRLNNEATQPLTDQSWISFLLGDLESWSVKHEANWQYVITF